MFFVSNFNFRYTIWNSTKFSLEMQNLTFFFFLLWEFNNFFPFLTSSSLFFTIPVNSCLSNWKLHVIKVTTTFFSSHQTGQNNIFERIENDEYELLKLKKKNIEMYFMMLSYYLLIRSDLVMKNTFFVDCWYEVCCRYTTFTSYLS